jgi:hypothetical protein
MSADVKVLAPIIQWKWIGAAVVGCQTAPPSGLGPASVPDDEPPELEPEPLELEPPELDPPVLDPPVLDPPVLDPPSSVPGSAFDAGEEPEDPHAVHRADAPTARSPPSRPVAMAQRNSIVR